MARKAISPQIKSEIQNYLNVLKADKLPIREVILFGSHAKGTAREWSDIDLCIISPKFHNPFKSTQYLWSKRKIFNTRYAIEPVGFHPNDLKDKYSSIIHEIKAHGIKIPIKK